MEGNTRFRLLLALVSVILPASAQYTLEQWHPFHANDGTVPPKLVRKVSPEFSPEARAARIQGRAAFQVVVDEQGRSSKVRTLSPVGFGLDERAQSAIEQWVFSPAAHDGKPVKSNVLVLIDYRMPDTYLDEKLERRRTEFNIVATLLKLGEETSVPEAVSTLERLAREKYPPAMGVLGIMLRYGDTVKRDPLRALALISQAAEKNYPPALYELGYMYYIGEQVPADRDKGLRYIRDASVLGSVQAHYFLGIRHRSGDGLPKDPERARHYLRMCASAGVSLCQLELGKLIRETDQVQAIAWLELAGQQIPEARQMAEAESSRLTPDQSSLLNRLRSQLLQR